MVAVQEMKDWPFAAALRWEAANHHTLRWPKTVVVSDVEKAREMRQVTTTSSPGRHCADSVCGRSKVSAVMLRPKITSSGSALSRSLSAGKYFRIASTSNANLPVASSCGRVTNEISHREQRVALRDRCGIRAEGRPGCRGSALLRAFEGSIDDNGAVRTILHSKAHYDVDTKRPNSPPLECAVAPSAEGRSQCDVRPPGRARVVAGRTAVRLTYVRPANLGRRRP